MGIFSQSRYNVRRVAIAPFGPQDDQIHKPPSMISKDQLMFKALLKISGRRKFRAAVNAVIFSNMMRDYTETRERAVRKLRASVKCINFVQLLEQRQAARRKFRASIYSVVLVNLLSTAIVARRKFRAAASIIVLSDRLVDRNLGKPFDVQDFQDAVNLAVAFKELEQPFSTPTLRKEHANLVRENGMHHLNQAVDKVLHGEGGRNQMLEHEWSPTVVKGTLVHKSCDFTTLWKFVESPKAPPNSE